TKLRNLGADDGDPFAAVPVGELVAEVARPHEAAGKNIRILRTAVAGPEPVIRRNVGLLYGLGNLIENAVDFAREQVRIEARWDRTTLTIAITDDGSGFPPDLITRLGEPYLTTRARSADTPQESGGG